MKTRGVAATFVLLTALIGAVFLIGRTKMQRINFQIDNLRTVFPNILSVPDPALVVSTYQWYALEHLAGTLIQYDHQSGMFKPELAASWSINGNVYEFDLKPDAKFHDGTPITAKDVEASIKRLLIKKSSTHFPIWNYFSDCDKMTSLKQECSGLMSLSKNRIRFTLKARSESFFLLLASPEGGIWSADDLMRTGDFDPTRFSGPYSVSGKNSNGMELKQNPNSPTIARFPAAPKTITLQNATSEDVPGMFQNGKTDVFFEPERPYYSDDFKKLEANRQLSSYNTMFYLYRVGSSTGELGADYFSALWSTDNAQSSIPAASFLPFGSLGILNRESYLNALRPRSSKVVRVAAPQNYFHDKFLAELIGAGKKVDIDLKIEKVPYAQWGAMIGPATSEKFEFDFLLAPYVASERFPSVQINFLLEGRVPPFELRHLDEPSSSLERRTEIENLEKWMISSQTVLPLVFVRNHLISARGINVGDQPITDAEVQLWRVNTN